MTSADSTLVLDMPRREMRRLAAGAVEVAAADKETYELRGAAVCSAPDATVGNRRLVATAVVDGVAAVLEIDTGALGDAIFLVAGSTVGKHVLVRQGIAHASAWAAGGAQDVATAKAVPLRLGAEDEAVDMTVTPGEREATCGIEGRIGLDVLRDCVFTIRERSLGVRCTKRVHR